MLDCAQCTKRGARKRTVTSNTRAQSQRYVVSKHGARAYNYVTLHRMLDLWAVGTSDGGQEGP